MKKFQIIKGDNYFVYPTGDVYTNGRLTGGLITEKHLIILNSIGWRGSNKRKKFDEIIAAYPQSMEKYDSELRVMPSIGSAKDYLDTSCSHRFSLLEKIHETYLFFCQRCLIIETLNL